LQNNTFSTLFVGQNLIKLSTVDSTNSYLKKLASNSEPLPEGTVIMAEHQFAGRGQLDSVWQTESGKNLTFSLLLRPVFVAIEDQFLLKCILRRIKRTTLNTKNIRATPVLEETLAL